MMLVMMMTAVRSKLMMVLTLMFAFFVALFKLLLGFFDLVLRMLLIALMFFGLAKRVDASFFKRGQSCFEGKGLKGCLGQE